MINLPNLTLPSEFHIIPPRKHYIIYSLKIQKPATLDCFFGGESSRPFTDKPSHNHKILHLSRRCISHNHNGPTMLTSIVISISKLTLPWCITLTNCKSTSVEPIFLPSLSVCFQKCHAKAPDLGGPNAMLSYYMAATARQTWQQYTWENTSLTSHEYVAPLPNEIEMHDRCCILWCTTFTE